MLDKIIAFCERHDYTYKFADNEYYGTPFEVNDGISYEGVKDYMSSICSHRPRKYQVEGVYDALRHNRKLLISPTASGKSLMIYSLVRYYVEKGQKILLVVPTTSLVEQMYKDFFDYGRDVEAYCHSNAPVSETSATAYEDMLAAATRADDVKSNLRIT